jgi:hypothetical protein
MNTLKKIEWGRKIYTKLINSPMTNVNRVM